MIARYFTGSILFSALSLGLAGWVGWSYTGTVSGTIGLLWITLVLGILEVSLSFDNAVVNASILKDMNAKWRRLFLTWGVLFAVFGMRIVFPLAIVAVAANLGPVEAVRMATMDPETYEKIVTGAHVGIAGFGGAFLAMVGLKFFFDSNKQVHWIGWIERQLARLSDVEACALGFVLLALYGVSTLLDGPDALTFLVAGIFGILTHVAVEAVGTLLGAPNTATASAARSGLAAFLYLEVLDASFSFDGVIGAFALSNNLFIIALGLGIGAMFVRSLTVMLVDNGTLANYRYLEHGAFWAILALAAIMLLSARFDIPETVTGLIGAVSIGLSFWGSVRHNRRTLSPPHGSPSGNTSASTSISQTGL